jgi:hypothetical protein
MIPSSLPARYDVRPSMNEQQDDLIAQLRSLAAYLVRTGKHTDAGTVTEAADRLEAYKAEIEALRTGLQNLHQAVFNLGGRDPASGRTYFEESLIKNDECHRRWVQLNVAQVQARTLIKHGGR